MTTTGSGEIVNSGLIERTAYNTAVLVVSQLPIDNVNSNAVLWVQAAEFDVTGTSATYHVSVYQSAGTTELGSFSPTGGAQDGTLGVTNKFLMRGGTLETIGSQTSVLDGDVTIHGGDVWIGVGASGYGTFTIGGGANTFTMDGGTYHETVNGSGTDCDLIEVNGSAVIGGSASVLVNTVQNPGGLEAGAAYRILTTTLGVNANSNFQSLNNDWVAPTLNDGSNLEIVYAP